MKRIIWTLAMAIAGFALGWHGKATPADSESVIIATVWGACIGFGFGSIFSKHRPKNPLLVFYWALTLALIGAFFSPLVPLAHFVAQVAVAAIVGALLGFVLGCLQVRFANSKQAG
jgi:hypothetical protein